MTNPVLARELKNAIGSPKVFLIRLAFVGLLSGLVLWRWGTFQEQIWHVQRNSGLSRPTGGPSGYYPPPPSASSLTAAVPHAARELFLWLAIAELLLLVALVPPFAAGGFAEEKEKQTLEMLLATPLKAREIVWGKLLGSLQGAILLILCSAPVVFAIILMGGVSPLEVIAVVAVLIAAAAVIASVSLLCSTVSVRGFYATAISYFMLVCFWGGTHVGVYMVAVLLPVVPWTGGAGHAGAEAVRWVTSAVDPTWALDSIMHYGPWPAAAFVVCALLGSAAFAVLSTWRVARMQPAAPSAARGTRVYRWLTSRPKPRRGQGEYRWLADMVSNAVMAKDLRGRIVSSADTIVRCSYAGVIISELIIPAYFDPGPAAGIICFWMIAFALLGGVLGATAIASEHERQTFELMRAAPLTAAEIVTGKIGAALVKMQLVIVLSLPAAFFAVACGALRPTAIVVHLAGAEVWAVAGVCVGVFWSALLRKVSQAVVATVLSGAGVLLSEALLRTVFWETSRLLSSLWVGPLEAAYSALTYSTAPTPNGPPGPEPYLVLLGWFVLLLTGAALSWLGAVVAVRRAPVTRAS
jgi:ABC-type transport system involved in multi-copper enzyme maturation permease subunit